MIQVPIKNLRQKMNKKVATFALILVIVLVTALPALANDNGDDEETNFLIPDHGYTVDYYRSYGEPTLQVSLTGDPEFKGEKLQTCR